MSTVLALWAMLQASAAPPLLGTWTEPPAQDTDEPFAGSFDSAPAMHWRVRLPGPKLNSATHAERTVPLVRGNHIYIGSAAGDALYILDRRSGTLVDRLPAANSVESSPALTDDAIVFSDTGGSTFCYGLDGVQRWSHAGNAPVLVQPTIDDGRVYVTNVDDLAVALDLQTGELVWRYRARKDLTREAELALYAAPRAVVLEEGVLLGFSDGSLVLVDGESGEEHWAKRVGEGRYPDLVSEPVPHGTDIYTSGYYKPLVALDRASQNVRWRVDAGSAFQVVIDARPQVAVIYHPGSDGKLRAVNALTGAELWSWDSGASAALTAPVMVEAGLLVGSSAGGLFLVDSDGGRELWRFHEPWLLQGVSATPVVSGRQLLFVSNAGYLHSLLAVAAPERPRELWSR